MHKLPQPGERPSTGALRCAPTIRPPLLCLAARLLVGMLSKLFWSNGQQDAYAEGKLRTLDR